MSLPKRDGVNGRYYLIHKPDTSPEAVDERLLRLACYVAVCHTICPKNPVEAKRRWPTCGGMCSGPSGEKILGTAAAKASSRRRRN